MKTQLLIILLLLSNADNSDGQLRPKAVMSFTEVFSFHLSVYIEIEMAMLQLMSLFDKYTKT